MLELHSWTSRRTVQRFRIHCRPPSIRYGLLRAVAARHCLSGYIYDWHEAPEDESVPEPHWYVGVVSEKFLQTPIE